MSLDEEVNTVTAKYLDEILTKAVTARSRLYLTPEGVWIKENISRMILADQDSVLNAIYQDRPVWLPNFNQGWSLLILKAMDEGGKMPVPDMLMVSAMADLPVRTEWAPEANGKTVIPKYFSASDTVKTEFSWKPPKGTRLIYVFDCISRTSYLFLLHQVADKWGFYLLPLPNLYETGKICTGVVAGLDVLTRKNDQVELASFLRNSVRQSYWNPDLATNYVDSLTPKMFAFSPDGKQVETNPETLKSLTLLVTPRVNILVEKGYVHDVC